MTMMDAAPYDSFEEASRAVLDHLHKRLGFQLWMVTRTAGDDWIVLQQEDHGYGLEDGAVLRWSESFCVHMVAGNGPRLAPRADEVEAYATAPIAEKVPIKAYLGVPLQKPDGSLFGTLCALDPAHQSQLTDADLELAELMGRLLSTMIAYETKHIEQERSIEKVKKEALLDALTELRNRRGWEEALRTEEARGRRFGAPASVFVVDLDAFKEVNDTQGHAGGDRLLERTADCLRATMRETDVAARIGGDEFGLLAVETEPRGAEQLEARLKKALEEAEIPASVGRAPRDPRHGLSAAWEEADKAMYGAKTVRKGEAPRS